MKREKYIHKLEKWHLSTRRKPLVLEGARQVGKTWLMNEFARTHYSNVVSLRFDRDRQLKGIFDTNFDCKRIIHELEVLYRTRIDPSDTILLFDEIQACRPALTALKYFCEDYPEIPIIAAGSLLGLTYRNDADESHDNDDTGFPVGKVNLLSVHPLSFSEYLIACGEERLEEEMQNQNWTLLTNLHDHLADLLRHYFIIGGMPEVMNTFLSTGNILDVREVQDEILEGYRRDFAKHAPKSDVRKIEQCWTSIPVQLAKENKKFAYSVLRHGGRASEFRDPLAWLEDAGLIHLCRRAKVPQIPLGSYADNAFKVYMLDIGLLSKMSGLAPEVMLEGSRIFKEFKGALTEQYVYQQLTAETDFDLFYWSTDDSRTEVDFIFQRGMEIIPLEVKSGENVRSQSLKSYTTRFAPQHVYRTSMLPFMKDSSFVNLPLFAITALAKG